MRRTQHVRAREKSATYAHERGPLGESIPYGGVSFTDLHEVRDRWEVAGCGRSDVSFVEARRVRYVEGPFDERWDGRLGLGLGGALEGMGGEQGASVFGLRLPGEAEEGELALGGGNEALYDGEVVMHPVVGGSGEGERWAVDLAAYGWDRAESGGGVDRWRNPDGGACVAEVRSDVQGIHFAKPLWAEDAQNAVEADERGIPLDCRDRELMPDLIFTIGEQDLSLTPYEYIVEVRPERNESGEAQCWMRLHKMSPNKTDACVVLGQAFLSVFYSIFDTDKKEIGCKSTPAFPGPKRKPWC